MARPKRETTGDSPLDAMVGPVPPKGNATLAVAEPEPPRPAKERLTLHLPVEVMERPKHDLFWMPGLALADLAAQALTDAVDRLEKERGEAFPSQKTDRKGGRAMK